MTDLDSARDHEGVPELLKVRGSSGIFEFSGRTVGKGTTASDSKLRWVEITLYKTLDGTGRYVLHRVGKSIVYHRPDGPCNRGVPRRAAELPAEMRPCPECSPPARAILGSMPWESVRAETDHHGAVVCESAAEAVERLQMRDPTSSASSRNVISADYSAPAQQLLDEACLRDPDIAAVFSVVRRI